LFSHFSKSFFRKQRFLIAAGQAFATIAYFLGGMRELTKEEQKTVQIMDDDLNGSPPPPQFPIPNPKSP
jgi:hypothetical protein